GVDGGDGARLGLAVALVAVLRRGDDHLVADFPTRGGLGQRHGRIADRGRIAELQPGTRQRCTVEVHASAAADDGRAGLLVHALDEVQSNPCRVTCGKWLIGRADFESGPRYVRVPCHHVSIAVEAFFAVLVPTLNLDEADVEARILVAGKAERPGDVDA